MRRILSPILVAILLAAMLSNSASSRAGGDSSVLAEAHLVFVGDLMMGRYVGRSMAAYGFDAPFAGIRSFISSADLAIGNLEGPIVPTSPGSGFTIPPASANQLVLTGDARSAGALARAGFDLLSLANNHAYDAGSPGVRATANALNKVGIAPFGLDSGKGQQAVIKDAAGVRIAFLGYTDILNRTGSGVSYVNPSVASNRNRMASEIAAARNRAGVDVVVVMMHWGTEYAKQPDAGQKKLEDVAVQAGADLIVGAHPHVAQGMEINDAGGRTSVVTYSLGNALFDQQSSWETRQGLALTVTVDKQGVKAARLVPIQIASGASGYVIQLDDDASGQLTLQRAALSTPPDLQWQSLWDLSQASPGLGLAYKRDENPAERSSIENLGLPSAALVALHDGLLTVSTQSNGTWQPLWSTEADWRVTGYTVGDANGDGQPDLVYTLWKRSLTTERPEAGGLDVDMNGGDVLPHIYINSWQRGGLNPLWHGSPRPAPALSVAVVPVGKGARSLLAVLESSNPQAEQAPGTIKLWEWTGGFGFELAKALPGTYSQMWSDGRVLLFK